MHSTDDEVEFLAVCPPTSTAQPLKANSKSFMCVRCGMAFCGSRAFTHHQLIECCMRAPSQMMHARAVTNISKLSGLDVLHVFALEKQAGVPLTLANSQQPQSPDSHNDKHQPPPTTDDSLQSRLEVIGRHTSLSQFSEYLVEKLLNEAALLYAPDMLVSSAGGSSTATSTPGGGDGDHSSAVTDSLTVPPLSLDLLHVPQYQQLFDRLREEAAELVNSNNNNNNSKNQQQLTTTAAASVEEQQPPSQMIAELLQQAEQLVGSGGDNCGAAAASVVESLVDWHYCRLCDQHVDRNNVVRHVHLPADICGFCLLQVNSPAEMMIHRRRCHQNRRRLCCPLCGLRFDTPHSYRRHVLYHRIDTELLLPGEVDVSVSGTQTVPEWQCELCHSVMPRGTITIQQIREHVTISCPLLSVPDQTFNLMFPYCLPVKS